MLQVSKQTASTDEPFYLSGGSTVDRVAKQFQADRRKAKGF